MNKNDFINNSTNNQFDENAGYDFDEIEVMKAIEADEIADNEIPASIRPEKIRGILGQRPANTIYDANGNESYTAANTAYNNQESYNNSYNNANNPNNNPYNNANNTYYDSYNNVNNSNYAPYNNGYNNTNDIASKKKKRAKIRHILEVAAAFVLVVGISRNQIMNITHNMFNAFDSANSSDATAFAPADSAGEESAAVVGELEDDVVENSIYTVASSNQDVYDAFEDHINGNYYINSIDAVEDVAEAAADIKGPESENSTSFDDIKGDATNGSDISSGEKEHSDTNLLEEGVDESDIVKTNGKNIYFVKDNSIKIVDIQEKKMKLVSTIDINSKNLNRIQEIYLDGDSLYVIANKYEKDYIEGEREDEDGQLEDYYYYNEKCYVELISYDVSNPSNPKKVDSYTQDGYYYSSRKVDGYIYLFTNIYIDYNYNIDKIMPLVNGEPVECNDVYIRDKAYNEFVMSSVKADDISKPVDKKVICNSNETIYMSANAIYLYQADYFYDVNATDITKFTYTDGEMKLQESVVVDGYITDSFAIKEGNGYLRVLTTSYDENWDEENNLYILDENLEETGKITGIAKNESIYAARYVGDIVYFITYENTDPLYVADLSDPYNPELLGSVEISGFSDYLHMFDENHVLGLGYETGEYSAQENIKLVMFDVSDPSNPEIASSKVIKELDGYANLDDYKAILVDPNKGIIGFSANNKDNHDPEYVVYKWTGEKFKKLLGVKYRYYGNVRGLYAGSTFYVISDDNITSFDMDNDYEKLETLEF